MAAQQQLQLESLITQPLFGTPGSEIVIGHFIYIQESRTELQEVFFFPFGGILTRIQTHIDIKITSSNFSF